VKPLTELELIRKILGKVATTLSSEKILGFAVQGIKDSFHCLAAAIVLVDPSSRTCQVAAAAGWGYEFKKKFYAGPFQGLVKEMADHWEPVYITGDDSRKGSEGYVFQDNYGTLLALPLIVRRKPAGFLYLSWSDEAAVDDPTKAVLTDLASLCSLILDYGKLDDKVLSMSNIDPLTGLNSFKFWHEELHREITRAEKLNSNVALLVVNLNRFKELNAMYGHVKGDEVLVEISEIIGKALDKLDIACRVGGRWHVLLVGEDMQNAEKIARDIIASFEKLPVAGSTPINLSIGLSTYRPGEGEKALIERVDNALMEARRSGGNVFHAR